MSHPWKDCAAFLGQRGASFSRTEKWRSKWRSLSLVCASHQCSTVSMPRGRDSKAYRHEWVLLACALPSSLHGELFIGFLFSDRELRNPMEEPGSKQKITQRNQPRWLATKAHCYVLTTLHLSSYLQQEGSIPILLSQPRVHFLLYTLRLCGITFLPFYTACSLKLY